jgi:hypothetical protein
MRAMIALAGLLCTVPAVVALPDGPAPAPGATPQAAGPEDGEGRGLVHRAEGAFDGLTLFSPLNSNDTYLIDMDGSVVHRWGTDSPTASGLTLLDDGTLLRAGREDHEPKFRGGGIAGRIQRLAPDGSLVWSYALASEDRWGHHDLEPLPNGNVLTIAWERLSAEEAAALGRDPAQVGEEGFWSDVVLEIRPTPPEGGEIVWIWQAQDHLIQDFDPRAAGYGPVREHPERIDVNAEHRDAPPLSAEELERQEELEREMERLGYVGGEDEEEEDQAPASPAPARGQRERPGDWLHTNAVAYLPEHDLIVLSTPQLCELWIIDHSTSTAEAAGSSGGRQGRGGDLLWRWGNPRMYGHADAEQRLFYQHNPTWIRGGPGELGLLVFNNGSRRSGGEYSSVDELYLPFEPGRGFGLLPDGTFAPAEADWTYAPGREAFFSAFISGAQRLPNGNTLICSGAPGRIFEVTPAGEVVWDYLNPYGGEVAPPEHAGGAPPKAVYRATRLARSDPGVVALLD